MSEANKYTLYGALFGLCFPVGAVAFLYFTQALGETDGFADIVVRAHGNPLLLIIDTAPFFLGLFARFAGVRQDRIRRFNASLEEQVREKTESLRRALDEAQKANEMIAHLAEHDALTGLLNRRRFEKALDDWMQYATRYGRPATLIFIDLDNFKFVNDTYSHGAGDGYLVWVGEQLRKTLRTTDVLARWGGDEFAILLPETVGAEAQQVAQKVVAAITRDEIHIGTARFPASTSVGLAFFPQHGATPAELLGSADAAMYQAKGAGGRCWRVYEASPEHAQRAQEHVRWEARIRRALENDHFVLFYQPLLNLRTGRTDGYEALLRMEDRDGQLISPGLFLESAERLDLSAPIDFMVIKKALRRIVPLLEQGSGIWVSLNLSTRTLRHPRLLDEIEAALKECPVPSGLRFEVTESAALEHLALTKDVAARVRELGSSLILDDFGLGPSLQQYLQNLPVSMVKMHPSLVRHVRRNHRRGFAAGLVETAHELNMSVVAKFVEDAEALETLRDLDIDYAQGFAVGRPVESIELSVEKAAG